MCECQCAVNLKKATLNTYILHKKTCSEQSYMMSVTMHLLSNHLLPQVWPNQRVSSKHGTSLSIGQVGCGLPIDGQDEITDTQTSITANGPTVDDTADQHSQTIFHGAHCHPFEVDYQKP